MTFKGEDLVFYNCPECGKRRLLWKKDKPPKSTLITRMLHGIPIKEHSVICKHCHIKYSRRRKEIEQIHYQQLKEERRGDKSQTILGNE